MPRGDDWRDEIDEAPRPAASARKFLAGRAKVLEPAEGNGTVAELFPNRSAVRLDGKPGVLLCNYRMSTLAFRGNTRERSPVCVGDRVRVEGDVIVGRCERRNALGRRAPNARNPLVHVIVANIDVLVVVAAVREPAFDPGLVDRLLAAVAEQRLTGVLCANKIDLLEAGASRPWTRYAAAGAVVIEASARSGAGLAELGAAIGGKTAAFCGNSGVGKTSLLRRLLADESYGRVGEISAASGKGRHTTSGSRLSPGPKNSWCIDTPGIMNFTAAAAPEPPG